MAIQHTFRATIERAGDGAFVNVPFDVEQAFGKKRVPVRATIDGELYRGALVRMGGPEHMLIVIKEIRERIGKQAGDEVEVTVEEDREPRVVETPTDLQDALGANPQARSFFETLSYSHRREYVRWIEEAKREATRASRVARTVELLSEGKRTR